MPLANLKVDPTEAVAIAAASPTRAVDLLRLLCSGDNQNVNLAVAGIFDNKHCNIVVKGNN
jgi:hypothetical protein